MDIEGEIKREEKVISEAERVLGDMPEFSQLNGVVNKINSIAAEVPDSKIDILSAEECLCKINGVINGTNRSEIVDSGEVIGLYVMGGADYVAPNNMIRNEIAENYLDSINAEIDKNKKAELAYYAIINMHLFNDGNGRTARAIYLMMKNGEIGEEDNAFLQHGKDEKGSIDFENDNNIEPSWRVNAYALLKTCADEIKNGKLPKWMDSFMEENGLFSVQTYGQPEQTELSDMGLNEDERKVLRDIFDDSNLAGYATAELLFEDGVAKELFEKNIIPVLDLGIDYKKLSFTHLKTNNEKYNSVFGSMTAEKYRRLIAIYNNLKIKQNREVIKVVQSW